MRKTESLKVIFDAENLVSVWRARVWPAMRDQGCQDLIEYYDYNVTIDDQARRLGPQVISGNYRASRSLVLELNKADKLIRRVQIPTPDDALVLQAITEALLPVAMASAPSRKAYFSRSHESPRGIHTMDVSPLYPWFKLWPKYQTDILDFTKARKYLVITDILNFFDSVPHYAIDRALVAIHIGQGLRDLTSYMLESFVQRELYAPLVLKGIPQLDLDAPRLLAHVLLYPLDKLIYRQSRGSFARWVDDINFGVDTKAHGREVLRFAERLLARIELRLNGRKTEILSRRQAEEALFVRENLTITSYQSQLTKGSSPPLIEAVESFYEDFLYFADNVERKGHWDQVYRRYINFVTKANRFFPTSRKLAPVRKAIAAEAKRAFDENVDYRIREALIRYWSSRKFSGDLLDYLIRRFYDVAKTDDVIAFRMAQLIVSANLGPQARSRVMARLTAISARPGGIVGVAVMLCKYGSAEQIASFIRATREHWSTSDFLARQIITLWSILTPGSTESLILQQLIIRNVQRAPADLMRYYEQLRDTRSLPAGLEGYVSPANMRRPYTLAKAIVASNLLRSPNLVKQRKDRIVAAFATVADDRLVQIALNGAHPSL